MGKTHLLCHVARQRLVRDRPTIVILSEQLANGEPWSEILRVLQLQCDADEFLGALSAAGQARGSRVLIGIDALNEGDGQPMWEHSLAGFLTRAARYPWVGVVVSVRKSYEDIVVRKGALQQMLVRVEHRGFQGAEARATTRFFAHYGIVAPTIPPLHPEFSNPLFLRLFCQALHNLGHRQLPPGLHGITGVFTFFLDSVNAKLSGRDFLDVDPAQRVVQACVERVAEAMATAHQQWLPREEARALVASCHHQLRYARSLFRHLITEGVLAEDRFHSASGGWHDSVRFTYEKFSDHLISRHLLNKHFNETDPASSFLPGTPLGAFVEDEWACQRHKGIIEALAIQLPEKVGRELPDLAPQTAAWWPMREAMVESIIWRDLGSFTKATQAYLNTWLLGYERTFPLAMSALLTTATQVNHPYNARTLHRNLMRRRLPDRDAWWSIYLHNEYVNGETNVITRLLDWCGIDEGKTYLSDDAILLAGTTVAWFFTSSNRFLRDHATKALVRLMTPRLALVATLIREFADVDDPYLLERLMATAYGCVLRSADVEGVQAVARASYGVFFAGEPPASLLLRDYARGVIERALHLRVDPSLDRAGIAPPYGSAWPERLPTSDELRQFDSADPAQSRIYFSVMGDDFARYIIGTNSGGFEWANLPLRDAPPPSRRERTRHFVASLSLEQRRAWQRCRRIFREERTRLSRFPPKLLIEHRGETATITIAENPEARRTDRRESAANTFRTVLSTDQRNTFSKYVIPFLREGELLFREEDGFDLRLLQGYILPRVLALGWTSERFGKFDLEMRARGRESHKAERIGKKYQWIAYYEALARIADQFVFKGNSWSQKRTPFEGPWQVSGLRDIDPSMLLRETPREANRAATACWWHRYGSRLLHGA
jgi:hypothetical protein